MSQTMVNVMITAGPWAMLVIGVILAAGIDPYINPRNQRLILLINVLVFGLMAMEITEYVISVGEPNDLLRTFASATGYAIRPVLLVLFPQSLYPRRRIWPYWVLAGINAAVYYSSMVTGWAFFITNNHFHRGPLNRLCLVISVGMMLDLTVRLIHASRQHRRREGVLILFSAGLIALGIIMDALMADLHVINFLTMAIIESIIFYYLWLHHQLSRLHEERLVQSLQTEHRIQLMISQIQPHFLFNTLSSIQALCETNPERAADLTERLGQYLRENLDSLNQPKLVPIEKEMEHTRTYAAIEQVRFPSVRITYDMKDVDFRVPALTVQPLVENAIRHGVRLRTNGSVHIATRQEGSDHVITIRDNGKGFDAEKALLIEGQHIGLRNVRERVEQMCGGRMEIDSDVGRGTTVTLRIPERGGEAHESHLRG